MNANIFAFLFELYTIGYLVRRAKQAEKMCSKCTFSVAKFSFLQSCMPMKLLLFIQQFHSAELVILTS